MGPRGFSEDGWNLIVVWECALKTEKEREKTFAFILRHLERWAR
jgi:G:T-mismatch repair DNA endonuclease (very short patch repair protein)